MVLQTDMSCRIRLHSNMQRSLLEICLLKAKQAGLLADLVINKALQFGPGVGFMGCAIRIEDLTQHQDIVLASDRVWDDTDRAAAHGMPP